MGNQIDDQRLGHLRRSKDLISVATKTFEANRWQPKVKDELNRADRGEGRASIAELKRMGTDAIWDNRRGRVEDG